MTPFVSVPVVHLFNGSLGHHDHAAFVLPFGQQAELARPETVTLLAELLEEPEGGQTGDIGYLLKSILADESAALRG